ncbi:MAG: C-GCAxxG-C-C family protein [Proteobacteria bacterium]|nr:C-GCAxxG-C-C family protein [Pseudomonadota bacterium]MBU1140646.1 C-GCAxxG-C-C family protein [Pseudomonadota bacterium]MBU1232336.1 C-GCAxxG-C-C family protein [Pseudomonadota bacterium]MBU1417230.1 C-GCAxxG-C-C family protein [Pseudomonadota bacterium]MBU1455995.1 C-GCAxxG-C-C family protein [Pseudomonadota bacterium]
MDDTTLRIMQLGSQGLRCSQILMQLALEDMGEANVGLVRALSGLCNGLGSGEICGAASGGACVIAFYAAKGDSSEEEEQDYQLMLAEFMGWFKETAPPRWGGVRCDEIISGGAAMETEKCGDIVAATRNRILEILATYGFDPSLPRESGHE